MDAPPLLGFGFLSKRQTPIFRELWGSGLGYRRPEAAINRNLAPILRPSEPVPEKQKNHLPPNNFPAQFLSSRSPVGPGPQVVPLVVSLAVPQLVFLGILQCLNTDTRQHRFIG